MVGINSDPQLQMEIEDTERVIEDLKVQLLRPSEWVEEIFQTDNTSTEDLVENSQDYSEEQKQASKLSFVSGKTVVEIKITGDPSSFTSEQKLNLLVMLAINLKCPLDSLSILSTRPGSIILQIAMPDAAAKRLVELYYANDVRIQNLEIEQAKVIHEQPSIENTVRESTHPEKRFIEEAEEDVLNTSIHDHKKERVRRSGSLKELTLQMARAVVNNSERVRVEEVQGASMIVLELSVDPDDMGRIIGKGGRVANAMRTLLRVSATKEGKRITLEIV